MTEEVNNELERIWKEVVMAQFEVIRVPSIQPEDLGLQNTTKNGTSLYSDSTNI
jgi:hypothetical protein